MGKNEVIQIKAEEDEYIYTMLLQRLGRSCVT
jgi:hypothetical protein